MCWKALQKVDIVSVQNFRDLSRLHEFMFIKERHDLRLHEGFGEIRVEPFAEEPGLGVWISDCGNSNCGYIVIARVRVAASKVEHINSRAVRQSDVEHQEIKSLRC